MNGYSKVIHLNLITIKLAGYQSIQLALRDKVEIEITEQEIILKNSHSPATTPGYEKEY